MEELEFFEELEEEFENKEFPEISDISISIEEQAGKKEQAENKFYGHSWLKGEWRVIQFALFKMAMHALPEKQRLVIKSMFFDGLSESEAAKALKLPKATVKQLKERAINKMENSAFVKLAMSPRLLEQKYGR